MLKTLTWRFYALVAACLAGYGGLGYWGSSSASAEATLYKWGLLLAAVTPLLFVGVYTWTKSQWWRTDVGTSLVFLPLALIPISAPLAYVFWFDNGMLTTSWLAWLAVSGPALASLVLLWRSYIWARIKLTARPERGEIVTMLMQENKQLREELARCRADDADSTS